jgi:hypothetical protein
MDILLFYYYFFGGGAGFCSWVLLSFFFSYLLPKAHGFGSKWLGLAHTHTHTHT